jgi:hypothetical protein
VHVDLCAAMVCMLFGREPSVFILCIQHAVTAAEQAGWKRHNRTAPAKLVSVVSSILPPVCVLLSKYPCTCKLVAAHELEAAPIRAEEHTLDYAGKMMRKQLLYAFSTWSPSGCTFRPSHMWEPHSRHIVLGRVRHQQHVACAVMHMHVLNALQT